MIGLEGADGKITPQTIAEGLTGMDGSVHSVQPKAVSLSQASEWGTVYTPSELTAISEMARAKGLKLHMDGARFANAMALSQLQPRRRDLALRRGCSVLRRHQGGRAGGGSGGLFRSRRWREEFAFRRKRGGHLASKMRFVSAQLEAMLKDDLWRRSAAQANSVAGRIARALEQVPGIEMAAPVETNMVFARMPVEKAAQLRAGGAVFHDWLPAQNGKLVARIATAFATPEEHVAKFIALAAAISSLRICYPNLSQQALRASSPVRHSRRGGRNASQDALVRYGQRCRSVRWSRCCRGSNRN